MKLYHCIVVICAIISLSGLAFYALFLGHDGQLLALFAALIAGLAGFDVHKMYGNIKNVEGS